MQRLVECVPNFSEGRNPETVQQIAAAIASVETACVLDRHIDPDHNRSVITFVATAERVVEAAFAGVKCASELIDMRRHEGVHPRLGATDVLPFVPIRGVTRSEEHTSELQSLAYLVCRLLLEKKKKIKYGSTLKKQYRPHSLHPNQ